MTDARVLLQTKQYFYKLDGITPLAGGRVEFYNTLDNSLAATYADAFMSARLPNPVILEVDGGISVWLDTSVTHYIKVFDADDNFMWEKHGIKAVQGVSLDSSHEFNVASNIPVSLAPGSILKSITSDSNIDISFTDSAGNGAYTTFKHATLSEDAIFRYPYFGVASGYGFSDNNGNPLFKVYYSDVLSTKGQVLYLGTEYNNNAGTKTDSQLWLYAMGNLMNFEMEFKAKGSGRVIIDGYAYPNNLGSPGQKLTTNGSKVLSWA